MKPITIIFGILVCLFNNTAAQDTSGTRIREYYCALTSVSPVKVLLTYKQQISNHRFFKIGLLNLGADYDQRSYNQQFPTNLLTLSAGVGIGIEFRKSPSKQLAFFHGPNITYSYNRSSTHILDPSIPEERRKLRTEVSHKAGIPYTIGILFRVTNRWLLAAEINPSISYNNSFSHYISDNFRSKSDHSMLSAGFDNRLGLISLVFRP